MKYAGVMELADVPDSKSGPGNRVRVRPPPPAPKQHYPNLFPVGIGSDYCFILNVMIATPFFCNETMNY